MKWKTLACTHMLALAGLSLPFIAQADVVLSTTRIIYKEKSNGVDMRMENRGQHPLLVQTWMDEGDKNADPSTLKVPFTITPPIARLDPQRGQTVTFMYTGSQPLPKDRESVYWFNALEIPPKPKATDNKESSVLQMAFRTRIKLFYRPDGIGGEKNAAEAIEKVTWRRGVSQGKAVISGKNDSPFYISYATLTLQANGKEYKVTTDMLKPFSQQDFPVDNATALPAGATLEYSAINDFGARVTKKVSL